MKEIEEINRLLLLVFYECKTDAAISAQRRAQKAVIELDKELKIIRFCNKERDDVQRKT